MQLTIENLHFGVKEKEILTNINLDMTSGKLISIIGPNGAGKSTLLKCLASVMKPSKGHISIDGQSITKMTALERAKYIGYVPQHFQLNFPISVMDLVLLGRKPYIKWNITAKDIEIAEDVLHYLKLEQIANRYVDELSGGERQLAYIARALVQEPAIFMLDEPISALDIKHQMQVLTIARQLANKGHMVIVVLHDLELASRFSDELILIHDGHVYQHGTPQEVITTKNLAAVYGVEVEIENSQYGQKITVIQTIEEVEA